MPYFARDMHSRALTSIRQYTSGRNRTRDIFLVKEALYQLSYASKFLYKGRVLYCTLPSAT